MTSTITCPTTSSPMLVAQARTEDLTIVTRERGFAGIRSSSCWHEDAGGSRPEAEAAVEPGRLHLMFDDPEFERWREAAGDALRAAGTTGPA
ncbi:MAG: hypothetical protein ACRD0K_21585 [Egibacteraceae bacterium]